MMILLVIPAWFFNQNFPRLYGAATFLIALSKFSPGQVQAQSIVDTSGTEPVVGKVASTWYFMHEDCNFT